MRQHQDPQLIQDTKPMEGKWCQVCMPKDIFPLTRLLSQGEDLALAPVILLSYQHQSLVTTR